MELQAVFDNLYVLHSNWLQAAMHYYSYHCYSLLFNIFFVNKKPEIWPWFCQGMPTEGQFGCYAFRDRAEADLIKTRPMSVLAAEIKTALAERKNTMDTLYKKLCLIKNEKQFVNRAVTFHNTVRDALQKIHDSRRDRNLAGLQYTNNAYQTKMYMQHTRQQQMGQLGTIAMPPGLTQEVLFAHRQQLEEYLPGYASKELFKIIKDEKVLTREKEVWMREDGEAIAKKEHDEKKGISYGDR
jgi:hypothetical protein